MFYYVSNFHTLSTCNYTTITQEVEILCQKCTVENDEALKRLEELLNNIMDIRFLKQLANSIFLKLTLNNPSLSSSGLTAWLMQAEAAEDMDELKESVIQKLREMLATHFRNGNVSSMTQQIFLYVTEHLENPNLTLKYIAEQHLFMNVDYVSKKFQKETGIRFSNYLADERIQKAKEYIEGNNTDRIQDIAERVGFGNNPQYFSQLFKKKTGITPSAYLSSVHAFAQTEEKI